MFSLVLFVVGLAVGARVQHTRRIRRRERLIQNNPAMRLWGRA